MGAWGHGPFENDSAMDFVGDLADGPADAVPGGLRSAMTAMLDEDDYLDGSIVEDALAAACLVAARIDPSVLTDAGTKEYLDGMAFGTEDGLRDLAQRTITRALDPADNEWYDLWADGGAFTKVEAAIAPFRRAVAAGRS
ncbi:MULTISPECIES: DUF4259 domain-containing protein [Thermomonosporaceae]|uniref:DUF4259 domain-containing protein n=1 Tax=Thermomonosporaceae TaxID=2012 RepID=UPI00255B2614|nr:MULTISPECIES: DUF4259 domain-containing protein [Thermomonosporaceae]MDL4775502.1 DUF4259 domain-containing protein [Actinomadura xylanilytica]